MAKPQTASPPTAVQVRYDLLDLPTTQHKAGLAGLLLQVESMRDRGLPSESIPKVESTGPKTVEATFTERSLCGLFDDLYDAKKTLVESSSKWAGATAVAEKEGNDSQTAKRKRIFVYEVVQPQGHFLREFTEDGNEIWHKLWRDMLWKIIRGKPTTRGPFNKRAEGKSSGEGERAWKSLRALDDAKRKNEFRTCEVAGTILLGAQAVSAEAIPFRDRADHAVLLHFWQLTVRIFVPEQINVEGKREFVGYVLAIPEVAELSRFTRRYKRGLSALTSAASGYRPADAIVSLPVQGALEFMDALARITGEATAADRSDVARALAGVEFFHMVKIGNNIKTMMHGHVPAAPGLLIQYEGIRAACRNPMFRAARLLAMLRAKIWYAEFDSMMVKRPWPLFIQSERTPRNLPSFAWDATRKFRSLLQSVQTRRAQAMTIGSPTQSGTLETLVYRLVRTYVRAKTEQKSGITYASFKDRQVQDKQGRERVDYPRAYTEAQEKVCSDLFLGLRSRRDDDFVSYFAGTIGSVAQGPSLSDENDYRVVAEALLDEGRRRDVKTLAMLAASAASYASTRVEDEEEKPDLEGSAR